MVKESSFNLVQILNQRSRAQVKGEEEAKTEKTDIMEPAKGQTVMMIDVEALVPSNENFYQVDDGLKQSIELSGILQPLLVDRPENGKYKVLAGHRRRLAVLSLIEEGKEDWRYVPCIYKEENVTDKLAIIMANRFREKTDWEKMMEIIEAEKLVQELKQDYKAAGRTRDMAARIMGISQAQIGRYKAIYKNLNQGLMKKFQEGILGFSVVSELCGLPGQWQEKAEGLLKENGSLSLPDIKSLKIQKEKEETKQKTCLLSTSAVPKTETEPKTVPADRSDADAGWKETEDIPAMAAEPDAGGPADNRVGQRRSRDAENTIVKSGNIRGYVMKADKMGQKFVYVYPWMHSYNEDKGKVCETFICPVCEIVGNRHFFIKGTKNCPLCGVNLGWESEDMEGI